MAPETPTETRYAPPRIVTRDRLDGLLFTPKSDPGGMVSDAHLKEHVTPVVWAHDSGDGARP
ncbi:MAG: hypothetical protein ACKOA9_06980 [Actinomycetota bacterium]